MSTATDDLTRQCETCQGSVRPDDRYCRACGYLHGTVATESVEQPAVLLPVRPPTQGVLIFGAVFSVLLALTLPLLLVRSMWYGPDDIARRYFAALGDRDAEDALGYLAMKDRQPGNPLLRDDALRDKGYLPPEEVSVGEVDIDGESATVQVDYKTADIPMTTMLKLARGGEGTGVIDRWLITEGALLPLPGPLNRPDLVIAGRPIPLGDEGLSGDPLLVFAGAYVLSLADNPLMEMAPVTLVAGGGGDALIQPRLKPASEERINAKVREWLDACVRSAKPAPEGCPFSYTSSYNEVVAIKWEMTQQPRVEIKLLESSSVAVSGSGMVRATGRTNSIFSPNFQETRSFSFSGTATASGNEIFFVPVGD